MIFFCFETLRITFCLSSTYPWKVSTGICSLSWTVSDFFSKISRLCVSLVFRCCSLMEFFFLTLFFLRRPECFFFHFFYFFLKNQPSGFYQYFVTENFIPSSASLFFHQSLLNSLQSLEIDQILEIFELLFSIVFFLQNDFANNL